MGLKMAAHGWSYYMLALLICLMFISGSIGSTIALILNILLLIAIWGMVFNDGAYNGEKACTMAATLEKQEKEGRRIDPRLRAQVYDRKVAAWILIFGMLPLLLIAGANAIAAPFYPEIEEPVVVEERESFSFDYGDETEEEEVQINTFNFVARIAFMPFVSFYTMVSNSTLNILFFLFALPLPLFQCVGYLTGPKLRNKKLHDIALGKKRKMRNLKVNKKPRQQKAEV